MAWDQKEEGQRWCVEICCASSARILTIKIVLAWTFQNNDNIQQKTYRNNWAKKKCPLNLWKLNIATVWYSQSTFTDTQLTISSFQTMTTVHALTVFLLLLVCLLMPQSPTYETCVFIMSNIIWGQIWNLLWLIDGFSQYALQPKHLLFGPRST